MRRFEFSVPEDPPDIVIAERLDSIARDFERIVNAMEGHDGD